MTFEDFLSQVDRLGGGKLIGPPSSYAILKMMYDVKKFLSSRGNPSVLNIFASRDDSGFREEIYKNIFQGTQYTGIDFWQDKFIFEGKHLPNSHTLPFGDSGFDAVITTKIIMEHVSEPELTIKEIARVLKSGGEAFLIASFVKPVHQEPYDFFRFTEHGLRHLFEKANLRVIYINPTSTSFYTVNSYLASFNIFMVFPKGIYYRIKWLLKKLYIPMVKFLDRYINDYGKLPEYYVCRVSKK